MVDRGGCMLVKILSDSIGIAEADIEALLALPRTALLNHPTYNRLLEGLDSDLLGETLSHAREIYESKMPGVINSISEEYAYRGRGMTAFTLGNWLLGFVSQPNQLPKLMDFHNRVPTPAIAAGLPLILGALATMEEGAAEWVKAMAVLSLPFFAAE